MPNWCSNSLIISHNDPEMIERLYNARKAPLQEFIPCPFDPDEDSRWYDWRVNNWGTKWDVELNDAEIVETTTLCANFDSPWSPPIEAYQKLQELGFRVEALYKELGMMFCGYFDCEGDHGFRVDFENENWADELPDELADYLSADYQDHLEYMREMETE